MKRKTLVLVLASLLTSQVVFSQEAVICPGGVCVEANNEDGAVNTGDLTNNNQDSFNDNTVGASATNDVTTVIQPDNSVNTDTRAFGVNNPTNNVTIGDTAGGEGGAGGAGGQASVGDVGGGSANATTGSSSSQSNLTNSGNSTNNNRNANNSSATGGTSKSRSRSSATSGSSSARGGRSTASAGSSSSSVKISNPSNTNNTIRYKGGYTVKNTPAFQNYTPPATTPCVVGLSATISLPGFGFGAGGYVEDERCAVQEIYRITAETGDAELHNLARVAMRAQIEHYNEKAQKSNSYNSTNTNRRVSSNTGSGRSIFGSFGNY